MPKVLISDKMSPIAAEIFKKHGIDVDVKTGMSEDELIDVIGEYDGLAIRSATKATPEVFAAAKNLKVIGRAGIGVDNIDQPAATENGVVVMNTPFGNSVTTAEHAISLMMTLARQIPVANASTHEGKWEKSKFMGTELYNKTLGLIGCGNIGSIVANRAQGMKMKVIAYDPFLSEDKADSMNVRKVELDELLAEADFITLHTPLNDSTRNILGKENISKLKKGVRIVNCARGGLIDETALKEAIESGHVAGAALDVYENEPAKENVLFGMEQVVCTPHLGASTSEAQENVAVQVAEQMADYINNGTITNALNTPSVTAEEAKVLNPYLALAEQLGSFTGQITESGLKSITIEYIGEVGTINTKPLTAIALKAVLAPLTDSVNAVNSRNVAQARGISVTETVREKSGNYQSLIRITVESDNRERSIAGTLFAGAPRVVELFDVKLEANLSKYMLYVSNEDKPGMIGNLGQILADNNINIANFHLGRNEGAANAVALVEVDEEVSTDIIEKILALPTVNKAKFLRF